MKIERNLSVSKEYGRVKKETHYTFASILRTSQGFDVCFLKDENGNFIEREFGWELPMAIQAIDLLRDDTKRGIKASFIIDFACAIHTRNRNTRILDADNVTDGNGKQAICNYIKKARQLETINNTLRFIAKVTDGKEVSKASFHLSDKRLRPSIRNLPCLLSGRKKYIYVKGDAKNRHAKIFNINGTFHTIRYENGVAKKTNTNAMSKDAIACVMSRLNYLKIKKSKTIVQLIKKATVSLVLIVVTFQLKAQNESLSINIGNAINDGRISSVINAMNECNLTERDIPKDASKQELFGILKASAIYGNNDKLSCVWNRIMFKSKALKKVESDGIEKTIENINACHYEQYDYRLLDKGTSKAFIENVFIDGIIGQSEEYMECFLGK